MLSQHRQKRAMLEKAPGATLGTWNLKTVPVCIPSYFVFWPFYFLSSREALLLSVQYDVLPVPGLLACVTLCLQFHNGD